MRHSNPLILKRCASAIVFAALTLSGAGSHAAELGDATVRSFIGQPLVADIELTSLTPDDMANLQVHLASPDVYRGANIGMNPALQFLNISISRRDQRASLHISSLKKIDANHVHLFLELVAGGRSAVRATTVWLAPEPLTASPPVPELAAIAAVGTPSPVLAQPSNRVRPRQDDSSSESNQHPVPIHRRLAVFAHKPQPEQAEPATCSLHDAQQCSALAHENATLTTKLSELEGKVKVLQEELLPKPEPVQAKSANPVAVAPKSNFIVLFSGGALLIGLVLCLFWWHKKDPAALSKYWALLRKPFGRSIKPVAAGVIE